MGTQYAGSGVRVYQASGYLNQNDSDLQDRANWIVQTHATPIERIRSITIHPYVDPTGAATTAVLGLELMSVVTVNRHSPPGGGTAFGQTAMVEGINYHIDPQTQDFTVDFQLTPVLLNPWLLGVTGFSELGTHTTLSW